MSEIFISNSSQDDDFTPQDSAFLVRGCVRRPDGSVVVPLVLDAKTSAFLDASHIDYQLLFGGVVKAFVASQQAEHKN